MSHYEKRVGYAIAVAGCVAILLIRLGLSDLLAEQARLMPFVVAVMAAAWWGGLLPGLFATLLGALLGVYFLVPPYYSLALAAGRDYANLFMFLLIGGTISGLCEALHRARRAEAEKQFRTLADSVAQLVWMARPDGYRFWFNERWCDFAGMTCEQIQKVGWQSFCDPNDVARITQSWDAALAKGEPWEDSYPLRRKDGQMRWHLARAVPVRNEGGEITCWFGTSTDIQDRIASEQALKEADERKNQFLATLAHELRNPLSPISNAVQLWPRVAKDPAEMEHLRTVIARQVRQMVRLIDDLMDLSRINRDKLTLERKPIDLHSVISRAVETVQPAIDGCGHKLTVDTPVEPLPIHGDLARLTQVFANLLNNAAKFTVRHGEISLGVSRQREQIIVRIRDNGPGVPPAMLEEIFAAFRQVDTSFSRQQRGLGIGLWLARQIVERHGGTIAAHSDGPGLGSEFVVVLPALAASPAILQPESTDNIAELLDIARHQILVVDDLPEVGETLTMVLRSMDQDVTFLSDGLAAVEWCLSHVPDVVILDIAMPGLDGYEVARRLRALPQIRDVVLVALTGYGQQEDRMRALAEGFDFHLTKPTTTAALRNVLLKAPVRRVERATAAR